MLGGFRRFNLAEVCYALGVVVLGHTLQISHGFFDVLALKWLTVALALCLIGGATNRLWTMHSRTSFAVVCGVLAAGVAWQIQQHLTWWPGYNQEMGPPLGLFHAMVVLQAACVAAGILKIRALSKWWFPVFAATGLVIGGWMIRASPDPQIDVVVVHREAIKALVHDKDPYTISYENVYEPSDSAKFYNQAAIIGGRIAQAYPYPPASLLLAVPGEVLFGDYRFSEVAMLVAAALLIGYTRAGLLAKLAACVLLTTPRVWFVIEQGWSEPIAVFMLALTVFLMRRHPILAGWAVGVFAVTKQYLGFTGLSILRFVFRVRPPTKWIWVGLSAAFAAALVTLPLALWHPHAFMRNVVWLQTQEPFRPDSLSYLAWAASEGIGRGSFVWAVGAAIAAAIVSLLMTRNTASGFATSVALTTFAMFAFGSKAFCNYYFFVIGALCCAIAAVPVGEAAEDLID